MITTLTWVPKGVARAKPIRFELSAAEFKRVQDLAKKEQAKLAEEEGEDAVRANDDGEEEEEEEEGEEEEEMEEGDELPAELRMDEYDDDEVDEEGDEEHDIAVLAHGNVGYADDQDDEEWDEEDAEDNMIKPTDNLLIVAMTEDEFSHLEVQIFSEDKSLFVHHDIALPDFPLSLAWMDIPPFTTSDGTQSTVGNYIAVGTFGPAIEIWNLDVLDPLEPTAILGGENSEFAAPVFNKKGKKIKSKSSAFLPGSHEAAVMGLSWNSTYRQALASGSADKTVKIWDVTTQECSHTFTHHTDKVQSVNWHPTEPWLLATGSFDRTMGLIDARSASTSIACSLTSDIESLSWDPFNPYHMYCATEDGTVCCVDIRNTPAGGAEKGKKGKKPIIFTFQAHSATTSAVSFSSRIPGMLATASVDKTVKVWDVNDLAEREYSDNLAPKMVAYKTMNVGKLFALQFSPDEPFLLASAGDQGMVAIWESDELGAIEDYFSGRVTPPKSTYSTLEAGAGEVGGLAGAGGMGAGGVAGIGCAGVGGVDSAVEMAVEDAATGAGDDSWMEAESKLDRGTQEKKKKKKFIKDKKK